MFFLSGLTEGVKKAQSPLRGFFISFLTLVIAGSAWGQRRPGFSSLDLVIDEEIYADISSILELSEAEQQQVDSLFEKYSQQIHALDDSGMQRMRDAGLAEAEKLNHEYAQKYLAIDPEDPEAAEKRRALDDLREEHTQQVEALQEAAFEERWRVLQEADTLLNNFMSELSTLLLKEKQVLLPRVEAVILRKNILYFWPDNRFSDFGRPFDLFAFIHDLDDQDNEIADILLTKDPEKLSPDQRQAHEKINALLNEYDLALREIVQDRHQLRRLRYRHAKDISTPSQRKKNQKRSRNIQIRLQDLNDSASLRIAGILDEHLGSEKSAQWRREYLRYQAITLTGDTVAEGLWEWITRRDDLTDEQMLLVKQAHDKYIRDKNNMYAQARIIGLDAVRNHGSTEGEDAPGQVEYKKQIKKIGDLAKGVIETWKDILSSSPELVEEFDTETKRLVKTGPNPYGPFDPQAYRKPIENLPK